MIQENMSLSSKEAYRAMLLLLIDWYKIYPCDELGILLGDLQIIASNGMPADPAMWQDWMNAIQRVLEDSADTPDKPWVMKLIK